MLYSFIISVLLTLGTYSGAENRVTVAAAANTQFVMRALVDAFEQESDVEVDLILGSSGKLTTQIANGAPYDIFLAANMDYPRYLYEHGHTHDSPSIYARGVAVIWTLKSIQLNNLNSLKENSVKRVAIANPKTAPYGALAVSMLKEQGIYDEVSGKLVYGESISQVNQYITLKTVDAGITSKSVVMSPELQEHGNWIEIPNATIDQGLVVLINGMKKNKSNTLAFYKFLQTPRALELFLEYGYITES